MKALAYIYIILNAPLLVVGFVANIVYTGLRAGWRMGDDVVEKLVRAL